MATESSEPRTADSDRVTFEVDRVRSAGGAFEVRGRWYGVRGRRFVRPTLTFVDRSGGAERRVLASLDQKPWAAEDGELWTVVFPLEAAPADAEQLELSVAPDINIALQADGGSVQAAAGAAPPRGSRASRARAAETASRRRFGGDRAQEMDRLRARVETAEAAHERERRRREAAERSLEEERTQALELRSELGRLRAELDLAAAARQELDAASAELETLRGQAKQTHRELQSTRGTAEDTDRQLQEARARANEYERALVSTRTEAKRNERRLHDARLRIGELEGQLEATTLSLRQEQAEAVRLRQELEDAEGAVRRLAQGRPTTPLRTWPAGSPAPGERDTMDGDATAPVRSPEAPETRGEPRLEPMSPRLRALNKLEHSTPPWADRPVNPSLRATDNWIIRILAVLVVVAALIAVVLVIRGLG